MFKKIPLFLLLAISLLTPGCLTAGKHRANLDDLTQGGEKQKISRAAVQEGVGAGMSGAEVAALLGAPSMITHDRGGAETWVYERFITERIYSNSSVDASVGGMYTSAPIGTISPTGGSFTKDTVGGVSRGAGVLGAKAGGSAVTGGSTTAQRSYTVLVKFTRQGEVRECNFVETSF